MALFSSLLKSSDYQNTKESITLHHSFLGERRKAFKNCQTHKDKTNIMAALIHHDIMVPQSNTSSNSPATAMAYFPFPRTGKRGVPQQFPRRLFEMLEGEAKLMELDPVNHHQIISWSDSGKAFKIHNITAFAETILPKYFRTTKHSSFQRNLNLVCGLSC